MTLSAELHALGDPLLEVQLAHPFLRDIADGTLDPAVFRAWLEQDFLFLHGYTRVFSRPAWQAPAEHLGDLVMLAHSSFHDELTLHRELAAPFGADLDGASPSPQCRAYTAFLLDAAAEHGTGLAALLPCMWGYPRLGQRPAESGVDDRYRRWVDTYADPGFAALAARCAQMLDEAAPGPRSSPGWPTSSRSGTLGDPRGRPRGCGGPALELAGRAPVRPRHRGRHPVRGCLRPLAARRPRLRRAVPRHPGRGGGPGPGHRRAGGARRVAWRRWARSSLCSPPSCTRVGWTRPRTGLRTPARTTRSGCARAPVRGGTWPWRCCTGWSARLPRRVDGGAGTLHRPPLRRVLAPWSSPEFAAWVGALAGLLGEQPATAAQVTAYREVAELEHAFWCAVHSG